MSCAGRVGEAVGADMFGEDALEIMDMLIRTMVRSCDECSDLSGYIAMARSVPYSKMLLRFTNTRGIIICIIASLVPIYLQEQELTATAAGIAGSSALERLGDVTLEYILPACGTIAKALGRRFEPYLTTVMGPVLVAANQDVGFSMEDADVDDTEGEVRRQRRVQYAINTAMCALCERGAARALPTPPWVIILSTVECDIECRLSMMKLPNCSLLWLTSVEG